MCELALTKAQSEKWKRKAKARFNAPLQKSWLRAVSKWVINSVFSVHTCSVYGIAFMIRSLGISVMRCWHTAWLISTDLAEVNQRLLLSSARSILICDAVCLRHLQGGPKKVSLTIFAITLSTLTQFS